MSTEAVDSNEGWHLDKKVPISIILALMMQGIMGVWAIAEIKRDVEVLKAQQAQSLAQQRDRDERQDRLQSDALNLVRGDIQDLGRKLDRYIEARRQ